MCACVSAECGIAPFARQLCGNETTTERCCVVKYRCCWENNGIPHCYHRSQWSYVFSLLRYFCVGSVRQIKRANSRFLNARRYIDQFRNDSTRPNGDLWRRAVGRGHGGATTRRPSPATRQWRCWWWCVLLPRFVHTTGWAKKWGHRLMSTLNQFF